MAKARQFKSKPDSTSISDEVRIAVLYGGEEMIKKLRFKQLRDVLEARHGQIEPVFFDGKTVTLSDVLDELRSYSLLQSYKIVIIDEAEHFIKTHRQAMERYAGNPVDHATLVLRAQSWRPGNIDKMIKKTGFILKCDVLSHSEAGQWLVQRAKSEYGCRLSPSSAALLVERVGADLMRLDSELAKVVLLVSADKTIEAADIEAIAGHSSDEQAWIIQEVILEAMVNRSIGSALVKIRELVDLASQAEVLVMYFAADLIRKLNVALMMQRAGLADAQIAKQLKLWGSRQQLFFSALRKYDPASVQHMFGRVLEWDLRSKSGLGDSMKNLECFCVELADNCR